MAHTMTTPPRPHSGLRRLAFLTASLIVSAVTLVAFPTAAQAHHGWDGFETNKLLYIAGTVSSKGNWGDPHSLFDITVDENLPSSTPDLPIPEELSGPEDSIRVSSAVAYSGPHDELEVIIAPPWWSSNNGLDRSLEVGERFQGVGYINSSDDGLFRPVAFWYGDDNAPVNQVIGNTLPVRAPLQGEANPSGGSAEVPSTVGDPVEMGRPAEDSAAADAGGSGSWIVWAGFGAVVIVMAAVGVFYVRRRTHQAEQGPDA